MLRRKRVRPARGSAAKDVCPREKLTVVARVSSLLPTLVFLL